MVYSTLQDEIIEMSRTFDAPYIKGIVTFPSSLLSRKEEKLSAESLEKEEVDRRLIKALEEARESHLVAATLIATVAFTAVFTMPGGYIQSGSAHQGSVILKGNFAFQVFVVFDVIAFVLSILAVTSHFVNAICGVKFPKFTKVSGICAVVFTLIAMVAMSIAFVAAAYVVLVPSWPAFFTPVTGSLYYLPPILFLLFYIVISVWDTLFYCHV